MSQRTGIVTQTKIDGSSENNVRVNQDKGDKRISSMTSTLFNPANLKLYHLLFIIIFVIYVWLALFSNVAVIVKSLLIVCLIALLIVESTIIFSYVETNKM
jgi:hypothetical protein